MNTVLSILKVRDTYEEPHYRRTTDARERKDLMGRRKLVGVRGFEHLAT